MNSFRIILDLLFPESCLVCGKSDETLCAACAHALPRGFSPDQNTLVILDYGDRRVKRALWLFKYRNKRALAKIFAGLMADILPEELAEWRLTKNFTEPLLVPIPISARRFRERGYNQAELMARELVLQTGEFALTLATDILVKIKDTPSQVKTTSKRERLKNLRGSFSVKNPETIRGRNIILLDDIVTTGATLAEARGVLKKAGAKKILAVVVAH